MKWLDKLRGRKAETVKERGTTKLPSLSLSIAEQTHRQILDLAGDITSNKNDLNDRADKMVDSIKSVTKLMEKEGDRISLGRR